MKNSNYLLGSLRDPSGNSQLYYESNLLSTLWAILKQGASYT